MGGDGNVGGGSVDHMVTVGVDSIVATLEEALTCHLEGCFAAQNVMVWR